MDLFIEATEEFGSDMSILIEEGSEVMDVTIFPRFLDENE